MAITVNIPTTARQDTLLARCLEYENARRAERGEAPYADVNEMSTDMLTKQLLAFVKSIQITKAQKVEDAYTDASFNVQSQVDALLGIV